MILCDREIGLAMDQGRLFIMPRPNARDLASTSVDLCLDATIDRWEFPPPDSNIGQNPPKFRPANPIFRYSELERNYTRSVDISEHGYDLPCERPFNFILGWTLERIYLPHTSRICGRVEGKSSLARMGLGVHVTAPTIHSGFGHNANNPNDHGTRLRLEIWNVGPLPIELVKGMRICQLIIEEVREVPLAGYQGEFNYQAPRGP